MSARLLVLGLDGFSWDLTQVLVKEGRLPVLRRLMAHGAAGPLESTLPSISSTAWATFMTGKDPGGHGIFGFSRKPYGSYYLQPFSAIGGLGQETLWGYLSHCGRRIAVLNVPVTYPPEPVNGLMISGFGAPDDRVAATYPPELAAELEAKVGPYHHDLPWAEYEPRGYGALLADARAMTRRRADYGLYCLEREAWDFFMLVFVSTDRLQHVFWRLLQPEAPLSEEERHWRDQVLAFYTELDAILGEFVGRAEHVIVHSDHGFGHYAATVCLNSWLAEQGYLHWAQPEQSFKLRVAKGIKKLGLGAAQARRLLDRLGMDGFRQLERFSARSQRIDWRRTRAFSFTQQGIYLNLRSREHDGIVEPGEEAERLRQEIAERLRELCDPRTRQPIVYRVARPGEVYRGSKVSHAPDLVIADCDQRYTFVPKMKLNAEVFERDTWRTGDHRPEGMVVAHGPRVASGRSVTGARLVDLFPTILALLEEPIPDHLDGHALADLFRTAPLVQSATSATPRPPAAPPPALSAEEEEMVFQRLKELGYLE